MDLKSLSKLSILAVGLLLFYTVVGMIARANYLDPNEPFPTWTYESNAELLNVWTSWDSGFYFDLANNGYPRISSDVPVATIEIPQNAWVKVFMGSGAIGEERVELPVSEDGSKVNNVVFLVGRPDERMEVPIYFGYSGIPYCVFSGPIEYERDVLTSNDSLSNPQACGDSSCDRTYVTYYHAPDEKVVFQEYFDASDPNTPVTTFGEGRHSGIDSAEYEGFGCESIGESKIKYVGSIAYDEEFTPLPFMPLYPMLTKIVSYGTQDVVLAGLLVSLLAFIGSAVFLYKLLGLYYDQSLAKYGVLSYMIFPFVFFNFAFLSVALFNLFFFAVLYFAKAKKPLFAAVLMILLVATNWFGLVALIPLFFIFTSDENNYGSSGVLYFVLVTLAGLLPFFGQMFYLYDRTDNIFAMFDSRKPWYGEAESFVGSFVNYFLSPDKYIIFEIIGAILLAVIAILGIMFVRDKRGSSLNIELYSMLSFFILIPLLNGGVTGFFKYSFMIVPIFVYLGSLASKRNSAKAIFIICLVLGAIFMSMWTISSRFVL